MRQFYQIKINNTIELIKNLKNKQSMIASFITYEGFLFVQKDLENYWNDCVLLWGAS